MLIGSECRFLSQTSVRFQTGNRTMCTLPRQQPAGSFFNLSGLSHRMLPGSSPAPRVDRCANILSSTRGAGRRRGPRRSNHLPPQAAKSARMCTLPRQQPAGSFFNLSGLSHRMLPGSSPAPRVDRCANILSSTRGAGRRRAHTHRKAHTQLGRRVKFVYRSIKRTPAAYQQLL